MADIIDFNNSDLNGKIRPEHRLNALDSLNYLKNFRFSDGTALTNELIAGIMGNGTEESGFDHLAKNGPYNGFWQNGKGIRKYQDDNYLKLGGSNSIKSWWQFLNDWLNSDGIKVRMNGLSYGNYSGRGYRKGKHSNATLSSDTFLDLYERNGGVGRANRRMYSNAWYQYLTNLDALKHLDVLNQEEKLRAERELQKSYNLTLQPDATKVNINYEPLIPKNEQGASLDNTLKVTIGKKEYNLKVAKTEKDRRKGLMGVHELADDEGMLFEFDKEGNHQMWMYNTPIPLDQIFINEDQEVIKVAHREPNDDELIGCPGTLYVIELNVNSGVKEGDEVDFNDSKYVMKVLAPDGSTQMNLEGGERIVSRRETKILIKKAKKAFESKDDKDYKSLGKYMFKVLKGQDTRDPEYVSLPDEK